MLLNISTTKAQKAPGLGGGVTLKWQPKYAIGFPKIDEQHKTLLEASDQFREVLEAGLGEKTYDLFLDFVHAYSEAHFSEEERCMAAHRFPLAENHKRERAGFLEQMQEAKALYEVEGFNRAGAVELLEIVDHWLYHHICDINLQCKGSPREV